MYGTREELCTRLENMFTPDEPLVLLVWTEEAFYVACGELDVKPEPAEIQGLMETTGNTDMAVYRREGVTNSGVCDLLVRHREAVAREVSVPAALLMRVLRRQEGDLENLVGQAWEVGRPTPEFLKQALHDVRMLMERI
ncbi:MULTISPECIES: DUF1380 family protein [Enterobacter]|uniref:DUF1380 family protein n=1 Tax=Enterobacter TaxID=547 RepID=UPI000F0B7B9B|nr:MULTISPECIES: DUF1380 family protein [Enterobacter]AYU97704.1 DUF1380 domain-containing protein [Enterobacter cloacae]MCG7803923.1 DUF1380 domain-containing protein [Enterobacter asburiae]UAN18676.1 DUF1380 family protein [Enterobacter asburiae]UAN24790.1 DUF1380 family protein [Enterobacter sp. JBIWA003]UAN34113.1 DUF1380 family protein [Enterobacter sp. JBIWA005]